MKKSLTLILALLLVILSGCSTVPQIEAQEQKEETQATETQPENISEEEIVPEERPVDPVKPEEDVEDSSQPQSIPVQIEIIEQDTDKSDSDEADTDAPASNSPAVSQTPVPDEPEPAVTPDPTSEPVPEPEPTPAQDPVSTHTPEPDPEPEPTPEPESDPEPAFDITYWTSFATSYGQQAGLSYDSTATACWDNPIVASSKSIYLERDITSRLDRYVRYGYTAFCVWSEPLADGRYNIYIGYA